MKGLTRQGNSVQLGGGVCELSEGDDIALFSGLEESLDELVDAGDLLTGDREVDGVLDFASLAHPAALDESQLSNAWANECIEETHLPPAAARHGLNHGADLTDDRVQCGDFNLAMVVELLDVAHARELRPCKRRQVDVFRILRDGDLGGDGKDDVGRVVEDDVQFCVKRGRHSDFLTVGCFLA